MDYINFVHSTFSTCHALPPPQHLDFSLTLYFLITILAANLRHINLPKWQNKSWYDKSYEVKYFIQETDLSICSQRNNGNKDLNIF